jgi:hypothetical protein
MRKRLRVKAVWDSDLEALLRNLGVLESLVAGEFTCEVCGRSVDIDNLGAIVLQAEKVKVTCVEASCIRGVSSGENTSHG